MSFFGFGRLRPLQESLDEHMRLNNNLCMTVEELCEERAALKAQIVQQDIDLQKAHRELDAAKQQLREYDDYMDPPPIQSQLVKENANLQQFIRKLRTMTIEQIANGCADFPPPDKS